MADDEQSAPELFLFYNLSGISTREANFIVSRQEVRVHHPRICTGKCSIEKFEDVSAKQKVVAIDYHHDIFGPAEVMGGVKNIL